MITVRLPRRLSRLWELLYTASSYFFTLKVVTVYRSSGLASQYALFCEV